jgi:hypothetical protein
MEMGEGSSVTVSDHEFAILRPFSFRSISILAGEIRSSCARLEVHHPHLLTELWPCLAEKLDTRLIARLSSKSE